MRETETHIYFWSGWLSNFFPHPAEPFRFLVKDEWVEGQMHSSEQLYMALKAHYFKDWITFGQILHEPIARKAKDLGRKVRDFDATEWNKVSFAAMLIAVDKKFRLNKELRTKLINTEPKIIVEASPLDKIWGVGLHETDDLILSDANWTGENRLGKVIMDVRSHL